MGKECLSPFSRSLCGGFVDVVKSDLAGQLVTQHDGIPALWTYSTDRWEVGETVMDYHPLAFETLPSGSYTIRVGLYTEDKGPVAVVDASGAPQGDWTTLPSLTIP